MIRKFSIFAFLFCACGSVSAESRVLLRVPLGADNQGRLEASGADTLSVDDKGLSVVATEAQLEGLRGAGLPFTVLDKEFSEPDFNTKDSLYHTYGEMYAVMKKISAQNSDICSLFSIGKTTEGREIWALRFNNKERAAEVSVRPGLVIFGNMHAREHMSGEVSLAIAQFIADHRSSENISKLLAARDLFIVPVLNPDGKAFDIKDGKYHYWRKNRTVNGDGTIGVDLNRNFEVNWDKASPSKAETYGGKAPFSEPETIAVRDFLQARKNIKIILDYHAHGRYILYPWAGTKSEVPEMDKKAFEHIAYKMALSTLYWPRKASDLYVAKGTMCDWAYAERGIFCFDIELNPSSLRPGGFYLADERIADVSSSNIPAAIYAWDASLNPYAPYAGLKATVR